MLEMLSCPPKHEQKTCVEFVCACACGCGLLPGVPECIAFAALCRDGILILIEYTGGPLHREANENTGLTACVHGWTSYLVVVYFLT